MSTQIISLSTSDITPQDPQYCRRILDPWVLAAMPVTGLAWCRKRFLDALHWRRKILKRGIKSLLSSRSRKLSDYRTAGHVKRTYDRTWSSVVWPYPREPQSRKDRTLAEWVMRGWS